MGEAYRSYQSNYCWFLKALEKLHTNSRGVVKFLEEFKRFRRSSPSPYVLVVVVVVVGGGIPLSGGGRGRTHSAQPYIDSSWPALLALNPRQATFCVVSVLDLL